MYLCVCVPKLSCFPECPAFVCVSENCVSLGHNSLFRRICEEWEGRGVLVFAHLRAVSLSVCLCVHVSEGCPVGFPECPPLYVSVCPRAVTSVSRRPAPACALGAASDYKSRQPPRRAGGRGAAEGGAGLGGAQSLTAAPSPPLQPLGPAGVPGRPAPQRPAPPAFRLGPDRGASRRPGPAMSARSRHERR